MGDLTALKNEILGEAQAKASRVKQKAEEMARQIMGEAQAHVEARRSELMEQGGREAAAIRQRIEVNAQLNAQRETLVVKAQLVEDAFELARQKMHQLSLDRKAGLLVRLMLQSASSGTEEVRPAKEERALLESLLSQVNSELRRQGCKGELRLGQDAPGISGGFIMAGDHYRIDNSFESLILSMKDDLACDVAKILFAD